MIFAVPSLILQTDALVLLKQPPADAFQTFTVFSASHGALLVLQRLSKTNTGGGVLDLFDEASLMLESSNQGRSWFVRETRLINRHAGIGRSYDSLRFASALAALVARNPVPDESRPTVTALLQAAFTAFAESARPDVIHFKSLDRFARDEGYPVKQEWLAGLPSAQRASAEEALNRPLAAQIVSAATVGRLTQRLEDYLRANPDIL